MIESEIAQAQEFAVSVAWEAGTLLREWFDGPRDVDHKGVIDLVTDADRASEALIAAAIRERFPEHLLLAEEGSTGAIGRGAWRWVVDPLDGTTNFAHRYPHFATSIALEYDGEVVVGAVYDPMRDEMFDAAKRMGARLNGTPIVVTTQTALLSSLLATGFPYDLTARDESSRLWVRFNDQTQGVRRDGAAALNLCYVAAGRLDGYWERPVQPWDKAAGALIASEAGALVTGLVGTPFKVEDDGVIAANPELHRAVLTEILAEIG